MQKETIRSSKLGKLRNFEILVGNPRPIFKYLNTFKGASHRTETFQGGSVDTQSKTNLYLNLKFLVTDIWAFLSFFWPTQKFSIMKIVCC